MIQEPDKSLLIVTFCSERGVSSIEPLRDQLERVIPQLGNLLREEVETSADKGMICLPIPFRQGAELLRYVARGLPELTLLYSVRARFPGMARLDWMVLGYLFHAKEHRLRNAPGCRMRLSATPRELAGLDRGRPISYAPEKPFDLAPVSAAQEELLGYCTEILEYALCV